MRLPLFAALLALCACTTPPRPAVPEEDGIVPLTLEQEWEIGGVRPGS